VLSLSDAIVSTSTPSTSPQTPSDYLTHWAKSTPATNWIETGDQAVSFAAAERLTGQLLSYLRTLGFQRGDVVALDVPPTLHAVLTVALFRLGAISCFYPRLVVQGSFSCDWLISAYVTESPIASHTLYLASHNISHIDALEPSEPSAPCRPDEPFRLIFSSGTTGKPKAVAVSADLMAQRADHSVATRPAGTSYFCAMDFSTTAGLRTLLWCLQEGLTYLVPSDGVRNLAQMKRRAVDVATMSPDQMRTLLAAGEAADEHLPALHSVVYAGSFLDPTLAERFRNWFAAKLFTSLGSTEGGIITVRPYESDDSSDMGYVVDDLEFEIVDENDQPLTLGHVGQIRYRRPRDPVEYFRDPVATDRVFRHGWCYPGDLGELTDDGRLLLRGRADDLVNVGGVKVDPSIFDPVAREVIGVTDAAGFSFREPNGSEVLAVAVVTTFGFREQELLDALAQAFGNRKPTAVVQVEEIPKTATGKTVRGELATLVEQALAATPPTT